MNTLPSVPKQVRWLWIALIWAGFALFSAIQNVVEMRAEGMPHSGVRVFIAMFLSWLVWALATPLVLRLGRRYPPVRFSPISTWLIHLVSCAIIGLVSAAWEASLVEVLNPTLKSPAPGPFRFLFLGTLYDEVLLYLSLYAALLAINYILESKERLIRQQIETARLNEQFSKAQLDALRRQIEPHFLFNALHAIAGLVREKRNDAAVTMIAGLSEFLQKYLEIQKVRFAERLQLSLDVPEALLTAQVPSLILQPVVENSIKHGISKEALGGWIRVEAFRSDGRLTLRVYNDGPGLPADWDNSKSGIGIANLRKRLRAMYGDSFEVS